MKGNYNGIFEEICNTNMKGGLAYNSTYPE